MSSRRAFLLGAGAAVAAGGVAMATTGTNWIPGSDDGADAAAATSDTPQQRTELVAVSRGSLSTDRDFNALVSFGEPWTLTTDASGTVTAAHPAGTVVRPDESLVWIDRRPLLLVRGTMPLYRDLYEVDRYATDDAGDRLGILTGPDVEQLQRFLLDSGFDADGRLEVDGEFGTTTEKAVKTWQESVDRPRTGRVDSSQMVFVPAAARIASELRTGDRFSSLELTEAEPAVLVDTSNRDRSALPVGSTVQVGLADGTALEGEVTEQTQVDDGGQRVWRTTVSVDDALAGDVTTATVTATRVLADDVLLVPVGALLALAEGGFAVEISEDDATRLVGVTVGEVLDGRAEISGDVREGDLVVVPT